MKKIRFFTVVVIALFVTNNLDAQFKVGGGIAYGTDINNIGISVNTGYNFTENWAAEVDFTYFFKKDYVTFSSLDFDANYIFDFGLYPIAGFNLTFIGVDIPETDLGDWGTFSGASASSTEFGFNLGAGYNFHLGEAMILSPEMRYTLGGANYFRMGLKLMYQF
jgi:opacity protein-like surface antigen